MNSILLPKAAFNKSAFSHYKSSAWSQNANGKIAYEHSGFYYIGSKTDAIEKLQKSFPELYLYASFENAKSSLLQALMEGSLMLPEIIFCDAGIGHHHIKQFNRFLKNHPELSSIPIILDGSGLCADELNKYRAHQFLDEIIFLGNADEDNLGNKIRFIKKVKAWPKVAKQNDAKEISASIQHVFKRALDIIISVMVLSILSPLFLLIALTIKLESSGPVFYISKRAGRGYKIFDFYKFRTMHTGSDEKIREFSHLNLYGADNGGPVFIKINNDPRITRVGSFLRNTSMDELPQFLNVLRGDMSLVGNRPLPLYEAETLTSDEWAKRFMASAGITGLWQIKKRGKEDMSAEERIGLDIDYAENNNLIYDFWIMAKTPSALVQKTNA
jgi:lipopolysaccharide/colanic/teichoic acid biosynthesis glycosyltransferase